jgi:DNA-directed RNA polymerase subunit RPC12/RpoP
MTIVDKPSSDTKVAPLSGVLVLLCAAGAITFFGFFFLPLLFVGLLAFVVAIPAGLMSRRGKCPNCGENALLVGGATKHRCTACKHRLVLRDRRLVDVT